MDNIQMGEMFSLKTRDEKIKNLKTTVFVVFLIFLLTSIICFLFKNTTAIAAISAITAAILTYLFNEISKEIAEKRNEQATINLYESEIEDLIRHLEANVEVLIQVRKELSPQKKHVQDIHFYNLMWPKSSILFSDDMTRLITENRVNDFSRLKVNIRNLNNYALWLQRLSREEHELGDAIDWVITRHFGYIASLYYMTNNNYHFPKKEILFAFFDEGMIGNDYVKTKLASLFKDDDKPTSMQKVNHYITEFKNDRTKKRKVFVE